MTDDEFDPEEFLQHLSELGERERLVAQHRPDSAALGKMLDTRAQLLHAELEVGRLTEAQRRGILPTNAQRWHPAPDSLGDQDTAWGETIAGDFDGNPVPASIEVVQQTVASMIDHLRGAAQLISQTDQVRSPVTLGRVAMEGAARASFITDPTVAREERLRRALNVRLAELGERRLEASDDPSSGPMYQGEIDAIFKGAECIGITGKYREPVGPKLPRLGAHVTGREMIQSILDKDLGASVWRSTSAVAHARQTPMLFILNTMKPFEGHEHQRPVTLAKNLMPVLVCVQVAIARLQHYLGWSLKGSCDEEGTFLNYWAVGAGWADDKIRAALFPDE